MSAEGQNLLPLALLLISACGAMFVHIAFALHRMLRLAEEMHKISIDSWFLLRAIDARSDLVAGVPETIHCGGRTYKLCITENDEPSTSDDAASSQSKSTDAPAVALSGTHPRSGSL